MRRSSAMVLCAAHVLLTALAWGATQARAQTFSHKDWELACDNTRTCRAAGYQRDGDELSVSVLLTRRAGAGAAVTGQVAIGTYGEEEPHPSQVSMWVNGQSLGSVALGKETAVGDLSPAQVAALLKAVQHKSELMFSAGGKHWRLSDEGAAAVLLKMDDLQGRVGTRGALVKKGDASEDRVLPPVPAPVVRMVSPAPTQPGDAGLGKLIKPHLKAEGDDCDMLREAQEPPKVWRLSAKKLLVSALCWRAAYNEGYGFWVANDRPPYDPKLVTLHGSDYAAGRIFASHKGRGLGDCWSSDEWAWNGREFVHISSSTSGMCKLVAPGGAWNLPTRVATVRDPQ